MALLRAFDGRTQPVPGRLLIGRGHAAGLRLAEPLVSGEHAVISWTGARWEIRDLGSTNGTFVDEVRLRPGVAAALTAGTRLAFGDPERRWELAEAGGPSAIASDAKSGESRAAAGGLLVLPSEEQPEVSLYEDAAGEWRLETAEGTVQPLEDQQLVQAGGRTWRVQLPGIAEGTPQRSLPMSLEAVTLELRVSRDEERVELIILGGGQEIRLEPREHGYVLLTLARLRQGDAARPPEERGWRESSELMRMLRMDSNALNVAIHRARQQLAAAGLVGAAGIVEVRRRERRLGTQRFRIVPLP